MQTKRYDSLAGTLAIIAGIGGPLYSVAFVFLYLYQLAPALGLTLASLLLLVGGVLSAAVMVALYQHVRETDSGFAILALVISAFGAIGGATHGAYDLANQLHPPVENFAAQCTAAIQQPSPDTSLLFLCNVPNSIDPRGLATFGFAGIGLVLFAWLMSQGKTFPSRLAQLGYLAGALNIVIYLARLIILTPSNPMVLVVAGVTGLIVNPAFFIWLGLRLRAMAR